MRYLLLALTLASTGCATILAPTHASVSIASDPTGAEAYYDGMRLGRTPTHVEASRNEDHLIRLEMAGYRSATCQITTSVGIGWVIADVLLTACVGLVVDAITGAWNELSPTTCYRRLEPEPYGPPQATLGEEQGAMPDGRRSAGEHGAFALRLPASREANGQPDAPTAPSW